MVASRMSSSSLYSVELRVVELCITRSTSRDIAIMDANLTLKTPGALGVSKFALDFSCFLYTGRVPLLSNDYRSHSESIHRCIRNSVEDIGKS